MKLGNLEPSAPEPYASYTVLAKCKGSNGLRELSKEWIRAREANPNAIIWRYGSAEEFVDYLLDVDEQKLFADLDALRASKK